MPALDRLDRGEYIELDSAGLDAMRDAIKARRLSDFLRRKTQNHPIPKD
jgi:hypothetical protein